MNTLELIQGSFLLLESRQNFMAGYECLRSNDQIDYRPLNLNIILHESDITYNLALCCLAMENIEDFKSFVNSALETAQVWLFRVDFPFEWNFRRFPF